VPGIPVDDAQLAEDLTLRGIAVEGIYDLGDGNGSLFEMDITTNRVDAMNHYGVAREAAAIYGLTLPGLDFALPKAREGAAAYPVRIEAEDACGRFTARVLRGCDDGRVAGLVCGRGGCHLLSSAGAEADFECRGCDEFCVDCDGPADARLRPGQD
jgi:phenylalanyl-tRNA synthetase beta chain